MYNFGRIIMNNIFENAYFGKPYKTRDGRKALYLGKIKEDTKPLKHILNIEGRGSIKDTSEFLNDGSAFGIDSQFDIVSEWQEEINEVKLDKLARKEYPPRLTWDDRERDAYKKGYRKALDGKL